MFLQLPCGLAEKIGKEIMDSMENSGSLVFSGDETLKKQYSTDCLFEEYGGQMFGCLVCVEGNYPQEAEKYWKAFSRHVKDKNAPLESPEWGNPQITVLKAFSGQFNGNWRVPGWVPPCLDTEKYRAESLVTDPKIHGLTDKIQKYQKSENPEEKSKIPELKKERRNLSRECQRRISRMYSYTSISGSEFYQIDFPPTGTGDCCAPKLLNYAFKNNLRPVSLAEFYFGRENRKGDRKHRAFYTPCDEKCRFILPKLLGLEILYFDSQIIVVDKPSGLLSVPGKDMENCDSLTFRLRYLFEGENLLNSGFPGIIPQPSVQRLDMDTSGILVYARTKEAHKKLSIQFQERKAVKEYTALLRGRIPEKFRSPGSGIPGGKIEFPIGVDKNNRPYQIYDPKEGRNSVSRWELVREYRLKRSPENTGETENGLWRTKVRFFPETGRTHQLRVHSAHSMGLSTPIIGDRLYGYQNPGERLCLHASKIRFVHPITGKIMEFTSSEPF